jgi:hypothetical protein
MYLLNTSSLELEYFANDAPAYAILSHRWGAEEVSFQDVKGGKARQKRRVQEVRRHVCSC